MKKITKLIDKIRKRFQITNTLMVNRVEVIDENGRSYVNWNSTNQVELQLQDDGKTLKIFIRKKSEDIKQ